MPKPTNLFCEEKGCSSKKIRNVDFCAKHDQKNKDALRMSPGSGKKIVSHCCSAACKSGDEHVYGYQYCSKCKEPCLWKPAK